MLSLHFARPAAARRYAANDPAMFEAQVAGLTLIAEPLRDQLEDMRRDRDAWRDETNGLP